MVSREQSCKTLFNAPVSISLTYIRIRKTPNSCQCIISLSVYRRLQSVYVDMAIICFDNNKNTNISSRFVNCQSVIIHRVSDNAVQYSFNAICFIQKNSKWNYLTISSVTYPATWRCDHISSGIFVRICQFRDMWHYS